jgi:nicotinamide-nucleotide amidase
MSAEIICIGTELLLGEILNGNAQYLAQQLAQLGIPHYHQSVVGDNPDRIKQVVQQACERSEILIFTGGLGPTPDDLTTETLADFFGAPLLEDAAIIADIERKFAQRGRRMSASNRKQALVPGGATVLPNPTGSAPGMIWQPRPGLNLMTFPGVPSEMHVMWQETAVPFLRRLGWGQEPIYSRSLKFWGIPESDLAEKVAKFFDLTNPTVAPYAGKGEVRLRVAAKAATEAEAIALITPVAEDLKAIAGLYYYGTDDESLASVVGNLLQASGQTLAVAESCTGGGLGQALTAIPGSSGYFWGGVIAYDNRVKENVLGVSGADLATEGAVSATVAEQMATGVRDRLKTDWGISITGIAGPDGGTVEKPVGLVYIGFARPDGSVTHQRYLFGDSRGRDMVRLMSANAALDLLRRNLL